MKPLWVCIAVVAIVLLLARTLLGGDWLTYSMAVISVSPPPVSWLMCATDTALFRGHRFARHSSSGESTPVGNGD